MGKWQPTIKFVGKIGIHGKLVTLKAVTSLWLVYELKIYMRKNFMIWTIAYLVSNTIPVPLMNYLGEFLHPSCSWKDLNKFLIEFWFQFFTKYESAFFRRSIFPFFQIHYTISSGRHPFFPTNGEPASSGDVGAVGNSCGGETVPCFVKRRDTSWNGVTAGDCRSVSWVQIYFNIWTQYYRETARRQYSENWF